MTTFTSPVGLPKPEPTDRVADGWDAVADLADAVDDALVADRVRLTALEAGRATTAAMTAADAAVAATAAAASAALDARLDVVEADHAGDTGWQNAGLLTGWANYGSGFVGCQYRRRRGIVHLRGMVKASGIPEHDVRIFVLPAGYRTGTLEIFVGAGQLAPDNLTDLGIRIEINGSGEVRPTTAATAGSGAVAWISLSGISFPADA